MRRRILLTLLVVAAVGGGASLLWPRSAGPNVVLVIVDTLRADKLGSYGNPSPASQELDALAASGIVLEQVVSQASWTRSSVAAMLTGMYPRRIPLLKEQWDPLPLGSDSLAEVLRRRGYTTIGLTANPQLNLDFKFEQGFGEYIESSVTFSWMKDSQGKEKAGKGVVIRPAEDILGQSLDILGKVKGRPVYLQVLLMDVHAHHRIAPDGVDADLKDFPDSEYLQAVRNATRPLATFIPKAREILGKDTVFIITADHGEGLKDHPSVESSGKHGNLLYRSQIHVPVIVLGPSDRVGPAGRRSGLARLIDLFPTIVELCGGTPSTTIDGVSLVPSLQQAKAIDIGGPALSETRWRRGVNKIAATDGTWLLIENHDSWPGTAPTELYEFNAPQDGAVTNSLAQHTDAAEPLQGAVASFEKRFEYGEF